MRPIPRACLIHAATLARATVDQDGNETLTPLASLTRVRVEPNAAETFVKNEAQLRQTATLLYDVRNSLPKGTAFATGQYVLFEGRRYRVESITELYDGRRLHHLELGLSG